MSESLLGDEWRQVVFANECDEDGNCPVCRIDYADCECPGPTQDGWTYCEIDGILYGRKRNQVAPKRRIRIESDGTPNNTDILDADTGESLGLAVRRITWSIDAASPGTATVEIDYCSVTVLGEEVSNG